MNLCMFIDNENTKLSNSKSSNPKKIPSEYLCNISSKRNKLLMSSKNINEVFVSYLYFYKNVLALTYGFMFMHAKKGTKYRFVSKPKRHSSSASSCDI